MRSEVMSHEAQVLLTELSESIAECKHDTTMDALEQADRESDLADWLEQNSLPSELAGDLTGAGITAEKTCATGKIDERGQCRTRIAAAGLRPPDFVPDG